MGTKDPIAAMVLREVARQKVTLADTAARAHISRSALSRWLSGSRSLSVAKAARVMAVLGLECIVEAKPLKKHSP